MQPLTQLTLAFELAEQDLSHTKIAVHLGRPRQTVGLWLKGMANYGLAGFLDRHTQAKKGPRRVPGLTVTLTSENSCRSPRLPLSATVWNIFGDIPLEAKKKNCPSVESYRVVFSMTVASTPADAS
ncbi:MAG: helix-turn-helix domain-containing protein [Nitrospira sp.]|nr:MAG: helix-turn-helix domain-containing protein [Nitrospira sp.]